MNLERALLIGFLAIYFTYDVAPILALPISGFDQTAPDALVWTLDALVIGVLAYWYLLALPREASLRQGMILAIIGVAVWVGSVFLNEVSGAITQGIGVASGISKAIEDFGTMRSVILVLTLWLLPTTLVAFYLSRKSGRLRRGRAI